MTRLLPLVLFSLLLLSACGGEGEPPTAPPTPPVAKVDDPEPATGPDPALPAPDDVKPDSSAAEVTELEKEGYHLLRNGDAAGARDCFARVLEKDTESPVAHRHLAAIEIAEGNRDRAVGHMLKALPMADRTFGSAGDILDGGPWANLAVDLWLEGRGHEPGETLLLEEALEADPTNPRAAVLLSEIRRPGSDGKEATRLLEQAGKVLATTEDEASLLLRLAAWKLVGGDAEGYSETVGRIPAGTAAHRTAAGLGAPKESGGVVVPGWPKSRPGRAIAGVEDAAVLTAGELDPAEAITTGTAMAVDRLVPGRLVPEIRRVVIYGYLPGIDAFLTDDLTLSEPVLLPGAEVRAGLLRPLEKGTGSPKGAGPAIAAALDLLAAGRIEEAWDGLEGHTDHPLAAYVRARIAITKGDGAPAVMLILGDRNAPPTGPAWSLLYAEALLVKGEVGRGLQVLENAKGADFSAHPLTRRIRALTKMKADDDSETVAALDALTRDFPDYAAAWEDLAGLHLAAKRYVRGREALVALVNAVPEFAKVKRYLAARRKAAMGIVIAAETADDLMHLDATDLPEVRRVAVKAAARMRPDDARKALFYFLKDPDPTARVLALRMLGLDAWSGSTDTVLALLDDPDEKVRGAATSAWAKIGKRDAAKDLVKMLSDDSPYVREIAVNSLRDLIGKHLGYDPRGTADERAAAVAKWTEYVSGME